ncbi:hypothetical protein RFI_25769 [Reticulomyxa filosa]|uniref:Uncharacterized protein n=1 Tax=Reticulomyxa filosa TaxID=46433 RepID=X6MDV6_RETFI|nr:hypothetical protein RFI_25769 [Reticulomyxa filosa]|eukprot:ETO11607.1 hypothetical protein RFI_25769 [Reticulomyxa filosa]
MAFEEKKCFGNKKKAFKLVNLGTFKSLSRKLTVDKNIENENVMNSLSANGIIKKQIVNLIVDHKEEAYYILSNAILYKKELDICLLSMSQTADRQNLNVIKKLISKFLFFTKKKINHSFFISICNN